MKHLLSAFRLLVFVALLPTSVLSAAPDKILASITVSVEGLKPETLVIEKVQRGEEIFLQARNGNTAPFWTSEPLGSEDKKFQLDGKPLTLASSDLDSDKQPEILTAAFYGPRASGLYGFVYQQEKRTFAPITCKYANPEDNRDFLVSDIHEEDGSDFLISSDGKIQVLGIIYATGEGQEPKPGRFFFTYAGGAFQAGSSEPLSEADK